jgi:hypothetical protein
MENETSRYEWKAIVFVPFCGSGPYTDKRISERASSCASERKNRTRLPGS